MGQAAEKTSIETASGAAAHPAPQIAGLLDHAQSAWKRNITATVETARAIQSHNADFASRLLELNLAATRSIASDRPFSERLTKPFELGASAVELYLGYLGRSAALAQQTAARSWAKGGGRS